MIDKHDFRGSIELFPTCAMDNNPEVSTSSVREEAAKQFIADQLGVSVAELNLQEPIAKYARDPIEALQATFELRQWLGKVGGDAHFTDAQLAAEVLDDRISAEEFVNLCTAKPGINLEGVWRQICASDIQLQELLGVIVKKLPKTDKCSIEADSCAIVTSAK
ncbi:MAG: hypothetical protein G01um101425_911 [Candidatus Peregrinibacteria bacterium Gr01-1014_25]|nr:MAG: hypothetical protein G01um101425_911 [Candidatus Peregrinibacteria bacterium Gr01-1014_25]